LKMPAMPVDINAVPANVIFRKTKMCKFNMAGRCMRGSACNFAHSDAELEPLPDFHRTKMCPMLVETGRCDRGAACTFAHKESELRVPTKGTTQGATPTVVPPAPWAPRPPSAPAAPNAPTPPQTLISTQRLLVGMGVVLLQVLPSQVASDAQREPPYTACDEQGDDACSDISDMDLDFETSDKPSGAWSRQSTEEGFEEPSGEFSRQSSEDTAWGREEAVLEEQKEQEAAARQEDMQLGGAFGGERLAYIVKNTFLQFEDRDAPSPALRRRAFSAGDAEHFAAGRESSNVDRHSDVDVRSDISDEDLDFDATCDDVSKRWSRQSTEEGIEEPSGEFSRQSSEESSWGLEELLAEQSRVEEVAKPKEVHLAGLAYAVKNTFLQFEDRDEPLAVLRRTASTRDFAVRGEGTEDKPFQGLTEEKSKVEEAAAGQEEAQPIDVIEGDGLAYVVKNSFLQFEDRDGPLPALRRVSSTGCCAIRGL